MAAKSKAEGSAKPTKNLPAKSLQKISHSPSKPSKSSVRSRVLQSTQEKISMSLKAKNAPVKAKATPVKPAKATPVKSKNAPVKPKATPVKPVKATPVKAKATPVKAKATPVKPLKATPVKAKATPVKSVKATPVKAKATPVKAKATPVKPVKATPVKAKATPVKPLKATPVKAKATPVKAKATPVKPVKATPVKAKATPVKPVKSTPVRAKAVLTEINIVVPITDEILGDTPIVKVPTPKKAPLKTFYMGPPVKIKKAKNAKKLRPINIPVLAENPIGKARKKTSAELKAARIRLNYESEQLKILLSHANEQQYLLAMEMADPATRQARIADGASAEVEYAQIAKTEESCQAQLEQIEIALQMIDEKKYGICQICNCEISAERLEIRPFAVRCVRCT